MMNIEEASNLALQNRSRFEIPDEFTFSQGERRIIELVSDGQEVTEQLPKPGPSKDIVAWVVILSCEGSTVEFAIDDTSRKVVRVVHSRSACYKINNAQSNKRHTQP